MSDITEEEAYDLDALVTKYPPKVDPKKARHVIRMVTLDDISADYLLSIAAATNKSPSAIVGEMIREKMASSI